MTRRLAVIATVTPNPAIEQTLWLPRLAPGEVNHLRRAELDPAGKGINVSRVVQRLGHPTIAFGFLAGETGALVEHALDEEGVQHHFVRTPGQTRVSVTVEESTSGSTTTFQGPGPSVAGDRAAILDEIVAFWLQPGSVLVLTGSLAPGMSPRTYESLVRCAREREARVIVDAEGEALRFAIAARPDLVKPSVSEAERLLGRPLPDDDAILDAAHAIVGCGATMVVISMGREGAICANRDGRSWRVQPPRVDHRSALGSGDAMVAGLAIGLALRMPPPSMLRLAGAAAAAAAMAQGTSLPGAADVQALLERVEVENVARRDEPAAAPA